MAFDASTREAVHDYASGHIKDEAWHTDYFEFLTDRKLAKRLGEEFISARYVYKLLEGLEAKDWLLRAQIRIQVMSYASIYEAALHSILFTDLAEEPAVVALTEFPTKKEISIPRASLSVLEKHLEHEGRKIIPTYEGVGRTDETKVRFDRKAECACSLGLVETWLRDELIEFYEARNAIHIHAEIRKSLTYEIDLAKRAYWRMQPFREQIASWRTREAASPTENETS
ncbi:hypothetical protein [Devosia sp. SD17-2]|uniref:hypothetical protein n=1 Tax=Devosia sp. SD17-2 TaxID=2976459 RepID=UPI0023D838E0|nr:hypothetical protein [Devosia sp. SD17-2]WEJ32840.1 hypothetical protein NYQ88_18490 [Devosia sp. SD17-2]